MRLIPVLDLMHGQVVRGIAGRRQQYRPLRSPLVDSADPQAVARAIRDHFGLGELYIADLDAIAGCPPTIDIVDRLQADGFTLQIDAGLRTTADATALLAAEVSGIVAGLETLAGPHVLPDLIALVGHARLVFSLDLKNGQPFTAAAAWRNSSPLTIAADVLAMGVRRLLVLDLARVGGGAGTGTEELCASIHQTYPTAEVLAGGGVRGRDDLECLRLAGVDGVLVASALHEGRLEEFSVVNR
jgi:phosphoribosylformimino-5-aminoimidazole carboxamide ribotide isomerase